MSTIPIDWYRDAFGEEYLRVYRRRDEGQARREVHFAEETLRLRPGESVLDLGCGAGRHLAPLLEGRFAAVGLDYSSALIRRAGQRLGPSAPLVRGDMRHLPFSNGFDAVLSFFTSFGYFFAEKENHQVIDEMARVLRSGGRLLLDLMDRDSVIDRLEPESRREEGELVIEERRWISDDGRRVEKEVVLRDLRPGSSPVGERRYYESVRLYEQDEVMAVLAEAGLQTTSTHGDFRGTAYRPGKSPRMILCARRDR